MSTMSTPTGAEPEAATAQSRLAELGLGLSDRVDFRLESVFPKLTGWGWKKQIRQKHRILKQVEPLLENCLVEGERVLYVAKGTQYSFAEQYFMGIWSATINHTVFVLTDVRLLMFRTNGKGRPKKTYWMVYYSQIDRFDSSWTRSLKLQLADGRKLQFTGFPSADRKIMPDIFREALERYRAAGFDPKSSQSLENLCTHCFDAVPKAQHDCEKCGAAYWRPSELAWRSLIFPSWGDWLMGHTTVAMVELIGTGVAWLLIIAMIIDAIDTNTPGLFVVALFIFLAAHGTDAAITAHIAGKGLHPKSGPGAGQVY